METGGGENVLHHSITGFVSAQQQQLNRELANQTQ